MVILDASALCQNFHNQGKNIYQEILITIELNAFDFWLFCDYFTEYWIQLNLFVAHTFLTISTLFCTLSILAKLKQEWNCPETGVKSVWFQVS